MEQTVLFSILAGAVAFVVGWLVCDKYTTTTELMRLQQAIEMHNKLLSRHEFEALFENNPHPELYDANGNLDRGEYVVINFPPDFDPETEGWYVEDLDEDVDSVW